VGGPGSFSQIYMKPSPPQFLHRIVFKPEHALQRA
jgi:hypothetical protein